MKRREFLGLLTALLLTPTAARGAGAERPPAAPAPRPTVLSWTTRDGRSGQRTFPT